MKTRPSPGLKVILCVSEDWFALSHFRPVIALLVEIASEVVVVTRCSGREAEIAAMGARVIDLDYHRATMRPAREFTTAKRIAGILKEERPDIVHMIAMKPIVLGCLALQLGGFARGTIIHMTGLGHLAISKSVKARVARRTAFALIAQRLRRDASWLLVENPDDLAYMQDRGVNPMDRLTILGGAGVDPEAFAAAPLPDNENPVVASVGRMIHSKGLDVLIEAQRLLRDRGLSVDVKMFGQLDGGNPDALSEAQIDAWTSRPGVSWHGHVDDVGAIWRNADIAVLAARTREGLPRAILEAAASARPLVVTDVPGCRHFVSHGTNGYIVPPEDAAALADALAQLVGDRDRRERMGKAARQRVLDGFTEGHVVADLRDVYRRLMGALGSRQDD